MFIPVAQNKGTTPLIYNTGSKPLEIIDQVICGDEFTAGTLLASDSNNGTVVLDEDNWIIAPAAKYTTKTGQSTTQYMRIREYAVGTHEDYTDVTDIYLRYYVHPGTANTVTDQRGLYTMELSLTDDNNKYRKYTIYVNSLGGTVSGITEPSAANGVYSNVAADGQYALSGTDYVITIQDVESVSCFVLKDKTLGTVFFKAVRGDATYPEDSSLTWEAVDGTGTMVFTNTRIIQKEGGWFETHINIGDANTEEATFDITQIHRMTITTKLQSIWELTQNTMTPSVTWDRLVLGKQTQKAKCILRFDDAYTIQKQWCGVLEKWGLKGTIGVMSDKVGTTGYLTEAELKEIQRAGHLICNHTTSYHDEHTHYNYLHQLPQLKAAYETCYKWLVDRGFYKGARIFILPGGKWNTSWEETFKPLADVIMYVNNPDTLLYSDVISTGNTRNIESYLPTSDNAAAIKTRIDEAVATNGLVSLFWHSSSTYTATITEIAEYLKGLVDEGKIDVVTPDEFIQQEPLELQDENTETLVAAGALSIWGSSVLDSSSAVCDCTLADGEVIGQEKFVVMTDASNSSTLTIANHATSTDEVLTFNAAGEYGIFKWTGSVWITIAMTCTA